MPAIDVEDLVGMTFNLPYTNGKDEKMEIVIADAPVACAICTRDNSSLETPG